MAWLLRHWLAWALAAMLPFTMAPFLAPVLMASGWTDLGTAVYKFYALFCHQLPQRSWFLFGPKLTYTLEEITRVFPTTDPWSLRAFSGTPELGWKVAWSDRMISFYTMTPAFGLLYALLRRLRPIRPVSWRVLLLALLPLVVDGTTHALNDLLYGVAGGGFRDTNAWLAILTGNAFPGFYAGDHAGTFNWWLRLFSGLLAAWGVAFTLFPWLDQLFRQELARQHTSEPPRRRPPEGLLSTACIYHSPNKLALGVYMNMQERQKALIRRNGRWDWTLLASSMAALLALTWPVWQWLWREWMSNDSYSHGVLIVPVALYLAWRRVAGGRQKPSVAGGNGGLLLLAGSLSLYLYFLGDRAFYLAAMAMVGLLTGLVWTLAGRQWVRLWAFPLGYLLLMVPLPFLERITYPLALLTGMVSAALVRLFGLQVTIVGNAVTLPNANLVIGAQCSGINSICATTSISRRSPFAG
ncbi:MAG TPA: exosortase/archaeosortase family protein [Caldilineaceae bacterium]|nr:exosortase/archaeosortase family protein [Caldilineaceae bacterium]